MKTALDNYEVGKQKEVSADDFTYVIRDNYRFICPECLERVTMVDGKNSKFFKHGKRTESTVECDLRAEENANKSIYERVGMPLFLRKTLNGLKLTIGFRPLTDSVITQCKNVSGYVTIVDRTKQSEQKFLINYDNFSSKNVVYKDLKYLSSTNLILKYSNEHVRMLLQPYWSDYIETSIVKKGALFHDGNSGGKIIRYGDCVTTYKNYLWVLPKSEYVMSYGDLPNYKGINFKKIGNVAINNKMFNVYEGMFELSSSHNIDFSRLASYLRNHLGLFLLDSDSSITPIWPPCVRTEVGYKTQKNKELYYLVNTKNEDTVAYIYNENNPTPYLYEPKENNGYYFGKLQLSSIGKIININRRVVSNGSYIKADYIGQDMKKYYVDPDNKVQVNLFDKLEMIQLNVSSKVEAYLIDKKKNIYKKTFLEGNIEFNNEKNIINIFLVCNNHLVAIYQKNKRKTNRENIDLSCLKNMKLNSKNSSEVILNAKIKKMINHLIKYDNSLKKVFDPYIRRQRIPIILAREIRRLK